MVTECPRCKAFGEKSVVRRGAIITVYWIHERTVLGFGGCLLQEGIETPSGFRWFEKYLDKDWSELEKV